MNITVTQEHINKGTRGAGDDCPIAISLRERLDTDVIVQYDRVILGSVGYQSQIFKLPHEASEFIDKYDRGFEVQPFSFEF